MECRQASYVLWEWKPTAPDSAAIDHRDRMLKVQLFSSAENATEQAKHVGV
jgi:hypothetical protein